MGIDRVARTLRCAVFAAASTVLAALAHAVAGVGLPRPGVLVAASIALALAARPLTRRERGLPAVLGATLAGQLLLHLVLTVSMVGSCATGAVAGGAMRGMTGASGSAGPVGVAACAGGTWLPMGAPGRPPALMVIGHLAAAVVVAWWLRRGERALAQLLPVLARALAPLARRMVGRGLPACPAPRCAGGTVAAGSAALRVRPATHPGLRGAQLRSRRGPPGPVAA